MQVKARGGLPIVICEEGDEETIQYASKVLEVPKSVDCLQVRFHWNFCGRRSWLIYTLYFRAFSRSFQCSCCHITSLCSVGATSIVPEISPSLSPSSRCPKFHQQPQHLCTYTASVYDVKILRETLRSFLYFLQSRTIFCFFVNFCLFYLICYRQDSRKFLLYFGREWIVWSCCLLSELLNFVISFNTDFNKLHT